MECRLLFHAFRKTLEILDLFDTIMIQEHFLTDYVPARVYPRNNGVVDIYRFSEDSWEDRLYGWIWWIFSSYASATLIPEMKKSICWKRNLMQIQMFVYFQNHFLYLLHHLAFFPPFFDVFFVLKIQFIYLSDLRWSGCTKNCQFSRFTQQFWVHKILSCFWCLIACWFSLEIVK